MAQRLGAAESDARRDPLCRETCGLEELLGALDALGEQPLVRSDFGARTANRVAQRLVVAPHREGDQAQFVPRPLAADGRGRLARLMDFVRAHPAARHTLTSLAARAAMSKRTLQREFTASTGLAPQQWLLAERVERAKELLETTRLTAQGIATRVGLGSAESLRHHFRRRVGTTPGQYRRRFSRRERA